MTMYTAGVPGLPNGRRLGRLALAAMLLAAIGACEIEWGGATVQLEDPSPPPEELATTQSPAEPVEIPLPEGPLIWAVRAVGSGGEVVGMPIARLVDGMPEALDYPEPPPEGYRERFDARFSVEGTELALGATGVRLGSLVLSGPPRVVDAGCPSIVPAQATVLPGAGLPSVAFGLGPDIELGGVSAAGSAVIDNRIRTFGPVLAEQLLRQGGESRPFLAQRADLVAVSWPEDQRPAMAATYLINDSVEGPGPSGAAASLFFLARFGPSGYVADWSEMRTYSGQAGTREIFTWVGASPLPGGRLDFAMRHDGQTRRLVASVDSSDPERGISWTEGARCPSLDLLESSLTQETLVAPERPAAEGGAAPPAEVEVDSVAGGEAPPD